jgi:recombination protein RecA
MAKRNEIKLDNFLIPSSFLEEKQGRIFNTCLSMDIALSGGIPEGISVLLSGKPKVGKTTLALHYVQKCHMTDPDKKCFFFDVEGRLRTELLDCFPNINKDNLSIIRSNDSKILTAEDYLNLIYETLKDYPKCICILDSVAALCPEAELSSNIGDSVKMASTATLMYKMFRRVSQILSVTQSTFIALTHMISNPSPGIGKRSFSVGGNAPQYGASVWIEAPWKTDIKDNADNKIGQIANFTVVSSALGAPGSMVPVPIIYGKGVDEEVDLFNVAQDFGLISRAGAWYSIEPSTFGIEQEQIKLQGQSSVINLLKTNREIYNAIDSHIRSMTISETLNESTINTQPGDTDDLGLKAEQVAP